MSSLSGGLGDALSVVTMLSATALIALKITVVTRHSSTWGTYKRTIRILVDSATLYTSLVLIMAAFEILNTIHPFDIETNYGIVASSVNFYVGVISIPMAVTLCRTSAKICNDIPFYIGNCLDPDIT